MRPPSSTAPPVLNSNLKSGGPPLGPILGGVFGTLLVLLIAGAVAFVLCRRKRRSRRSGNRGPALAHNSDEEEGLVGKGAANSEREKKKKKKGTKEKDPTVRELSREPSRAYSLAETEESVESYVTERFGEADRRGDIREQMIATQEELLTMVGMGMSEKEKEVLEERLAAEQTAAAAPAVLMEKLNWLQTNQETNWARGLTNRPPPGYEKYFSS